MAAVDDIAGDRLLRVQDRQVILERIPFAPEGAPGGGEGPGSG